MTVSVRAARLGFAVVLGVIFVMSLVPVPDGLMVFRWQDKVEHALAFTTLGLLGAVARAGRPGPRAAGLLVYGALIEVAQGLTAYRTADVTDWLADAFGVALAALFARQCICCSRLAKSRS
ncbi:VanZ family protein [Nitrogeniibacter mangrovi]|uniref:VanZ family protein n=1 Tax=Nitrogeniibacter mangrovi TaxID=2016596 RepID=A0A6C1B9T5_9RHOO|nr:VanZ family protein [Nitrogeniibacter mangrovi]QID19625.1 VanZ family protein [Nitrogeniibacter mangrovi]